MKAKADMDKATTTSDGGRTPTLMAALSGHVDALQVRVQAKADVDKASTSGAAPACMRVLRLYVATATHCRSWCKRRLT